MRLSNSELMRKADNIAINEVGIASTLLMETAAGHLARAAYEYVRSGGAAYIFCGSGNNGGDGVAAALWLREKGVDVRVLLTGSRDKLTADTAEMVRRLEAAGGGLEDFEPSDDFARELGRAGVIIDAMFGIGLNKPLRGRAATAVEMINAAGVPVVAADIASGIEADTGRVLGCAVMARETVTFSLAKVGHFAEPGNVHTGKLRVVDIGIPAEIVDAAVINVQSLSDGEVKLPKRKPISHKGDYGKLLILGGCADYCGAPNMCSAAAVRCGAGLVYLGVPEGIHGICAVKNTEAMPFALAEDGEGRLAYGAIEKIKEKLSQCRVCVLGPGMGRSDDIAALVREIVRIFEGRLILDADGLWALAQDMSVLKESKGEIVLTPHEGEFVRMGGVLTGDRVGDARAFAAQHNVTLVLKGHRSIVAYPDGEAYISTHGNAGMAKGGSGDVLVGIIGAMLGQLDFKRAVNTGVYLHGLAGDICRDKLGEYAMAAGDIIAALPEATMNIIEE